MLFNDLFESDREPYQQAIDRLEMAHINNLNAKMDEIIGRVNREKLTDEHKAALKKEYIRLKAERDSIYGIKDGTPEFTVECDAEGNASVIDRIGQAIAQFTAKKYGSTAFDAATAYAGTTFKKANLDDIAGWANAAARKTGPVRLRPVVKQKQNTEVVVSEWRNTAPGADEEQRKLKKVGIVRQKTHRMSEESSEQELDEEYKPVTKPVPQPKKLNPGWALDPTTKAELKRRKDVRNRVGVDEGWSDAIVSQRTGTPRTPYSVYINGKKWKDFENDDHAEAVANKLRAKFKADGRDPSVITIAPTDYDKDIKEGFGDTVKKAAKYAMGGMRVNNAIRKHERKHDAAMKANDITTAKKEFGHVNRLDNKFNPVDDPMEEGSMSDAEHHASGAKFGGYYKGTQVGAPRPGQSFGAESKEMDEAMYRDPGSFITWAQKQGNRFAGFLQKPEIWRAAQDAYRQEFAESISKKDLVSRLQKDLPKITDPKNKNAKPVKWTGPKSDEDYGYTGYQGHGMPADKQGMEEGAKVDRMVKHIAKSERASGKSAKDAEAIAWATANKRGMLDNVNKKDEGMNFMEWAVAQGSRFNNFATNPEVYSQARTAYLNEDIYGGIPKIAKVPTGAMYSNAKLPTLKTNLRKAKEQKARVAKKLNSSLTEDDLQEIFGPELQAVGGIGGLLKDYGIPMAAFASVVAAYGLSKAIESLNQDNNKFKKMVAHAMDVVDKKIIQTIVSKLNQLAFTEDSAAEAELKPGQYYVWTVHFDDGTDSKVKVTSDQFDPKAYYAKKNKVVIKTDYDWTIHG
jgi:hypothetical protein